MSLYCRRFRLTGLVLSLLLSTTACKTVPPALEFKSAETRQAELQALQNWNALGRIAVNTPDEGFSASMDWQQRKADFEITLTALLGQRALHVSQQGNNAVLETRGRDAVSGPDAEVLLLRELGARVPLVQLGAWMRGLPGENTRTDFDEFGRLRSLRYLDRDGTQWVAEFLRYQQFDALQLPELITVKGNEYSIRVLVNNWKRLATPVDTGDITKPVVNQGSPAVEPTAPPDKSPVRLSIPGA